jgi:hypothetical protein
MFIAVEVNLMRSCSRMQLRAGRRLAAGPELAPEPGDDVTLDAPCWSEADMAAIQAQIGLAGKNGDMRFRLKRKLAIMQGRQAGGMFGTFEGCSE